MISISSRSCVGEIGAAGLLVDVERFLALLDHLAHDVEDVGVGERHALGAARLAFHDGGVDQAQRRDAALLPAFIAALSALLMSSRSTSTSCGLQALDIRIRHRRTAIKAHTASTNPNGHAPCMNP